MQNDSLFRQSCKFLPAPLTVAQSCAAPGFAEAIGVLLERFGAATSTLRSYIMFVARGHSGHSLIGSLLDAHPSLIVANEANAMQWWAGPQNGTFSPSDRPARSEMFRYLYENSLKCALFTRWQHGYNYTVPHQANGQFVGKLLGIGDKKGGLTANLLLEWERAGQLEQHWREWEAYVALPISVIHVWWANQWYSSSRRTTSRLLERIVGAGKTTTALEFNNTAFVHDPGRMIPKFCKFLRIPCDDRLKDSWAAMVDPDKEG